MNAGGRVRWAVLVRVCKIVMLREMGTMSSLAHEVSVGSKNFIKNWARGQSCDTPVTNLCYLIMLEL